MSFVALTQIIRRGGERQRFFGRRKAEWSRDGESDTEFVTVLIGGEMAPANAPENPRTWESLSKPCRFLVQI